MQGKVYEQILDRTKKGQKSLALLIDPDKYTDAALLKVVSLANEGGISYIFVGGSLLVADRMRQTIQLIKEQCNLPVLLFPGSTLQFCHEADALLFLSLISGRNADLLIGRHVEIAPFLKKSPVEVIATGYMLIDGGKPTTASYISNTFPIPANKPEIAACTAMAAEMLGMKLIYMDGGSGAHTPVPPKMIEMVKSQVELPIIIGGGIRTASQLHDAAISGADIIVVGNIIEEQPELLLHLANAMPSPA